MARDPHYPKNHTLTLHRGGDSDPIPVDSIGDVKAMLTKEKAGTKWTVEKVCNQNHKRNPGATLTFSYKRFDLLLVCNICGCIRRSIRAVEKTTDTFGQVRGIPPLVLRDASNNCTNPVCLEYKSYRNGKVTQRLRFAKCECGRTCLEGHKCTICDPNAPTDPCGSYQPFNEWAKFRRESECPKLAKLRFYENYPTDEWLIRDLTLPDVAQRMHWFVNWDYAHEWEHVLTDEEKKYYNEIEHQQYVEEWGE